MIKSLEQDCSGPVGVPFWSLKEMMDPHTFSCRQRQFQSVSNLFSTGFFCFSPRSWRNRLVWLYSLKASIKLKIKLGLNFLSKELSKELSVKEREGKTSLLLCCCRIYFAVLSCLKMGFFFQTTSMKHNLLYPWTFQTAALFCMSALEGNTFPYQVLELNIPKF